jgi:transposase-like protein
MSNGKAESVTCPRCGDDHVRTSRQALHLLAWAYCATFKRQRYRCLRCNSRFYGPRRYPKSRQPGSDDHPSVARRPADPNGAAS